VASIRFSAFQTRVPHTQGLSGPPRRTTLESFVPEHSTHSQLSMPEFKIETECFWCEEASAGLDEDHVFPRSIGGTKKLFVPSCRVCQTSISKAEADLSRKSAYAMYLVEAGPRGRHRRTDPASGLIEAAYTLVPHPLGGYNETALKAGAGESPTALPYVEINVADGSFACRRRASEPAEMDKLVSAFEQLRAGKPNQNGLVRELFRAHS